MAEQLGLPEASKQHYIRRLDFKHKAGRDAPFRRIYVFNPDIHLEYMREAYAPFFAFPAEDWLVDFDKLWFKVTTSSVSRLPEHTEQHMQTNIRDVIEDGEHIAVPFVSRKRVSGKPTRRQAQKEETVFSQIARLELSGTITGRKFQQLEISDLRAKDLDDAPAYRGGAKSPIRLQRFRKFALYEQNNGHKPRPIEIRHQNWDVNEQKAFPETAYLIDKNTTYEPICEACPREPLHVAGRCQVGDPICHVQLKEYFDEDFYGNLAKYTKWTDENIDVREMCKQDEEASDEA